MHIKKFLVIVSTWIWVGMISINPLIKINSNSSPSQNNTTDLTGLNTDINDQDYFPMILNHTWRYRWWNNVYETGDIMDNVTLIGQNGNTNIFYVVSTHPWSHDGRFNFDLRNDGVTISGSSTVGGSHFPVPYYYAFHFLEAGSSTLLKYPIILGDQWTNIITHDGLTTTGITTVVGFDTAIVPAGTFEALHTSTQISTTGSPTQSGIKDMWFANHIGLIKLVFHHNDGTITTVELDPPSPQFSHAVTNPVIKPQASTWESVKLMGPTVLYNQTLGKYQMWYSGIADTNYELIPRYRIGYAESSDGLFWTRSSANPVIGTGSTGAWDEGGVAFPTVIVQNGEYKIWYTGVNSTGAPSIGYATSPNGSDWDKNDANPVLIGGAPDDWDHLGVRDPSVIFQNGEYHIWYSDEGLPSSIGYATSSNGIVWIKHSGPVLEPGASGSWDSAGVFGPAVFYDNNYHRYEMWYAAYEGESHTTNRFGRAFSLDGIVWTKDSTNPVLYPESDYRNPILKFGSANDWEAYDIQQPFVLMENGQRRIWYSGLGWIPGGTAGAAVPQAQIGYAEEPYRIFLPVLLK